MDLGLIVPWDFDIVTSKEIMNPILLTHRKLKAIILMQIWRTQHQHGKTSTHETGNSVFVNVCFPGEGRPDPDLAPRMTKWNSKWRQSHLHLKARAPAVIASTMSFGAGVTQPRPPRCLPGAPGCVREAAVCWLLCNIPRTSCLQSVSSQSRLPESSEGHCWETCYSTLCSHLTVCHTKPDATITDSGNVVCTLLRPFSCSVCVNLNSLGVRSSRRVYMCLWQPMCLPNGVFWPWLVLHA